MIRTQYHFRKVGADTQIWEVRKLLSMAEHLPVVYWPVSRIAEVEEDYWTANNDPLSCRSILEHAQLIKNADLSYPVLLCSEGRVMDGMHRVMKAVEFNRPSIRAKTFLVTPECHYTNVSASDLVY